MAEIGETSQSPSASAGPSDPAQRRLSMVSVQSVPGTVSLAGSRQSDETTPISDSAFQTPDPGVSSLSLPPLSSPTSADAQQHDDSRQPDRLRDSGIDTSTPTNHRFSNRFSQSMPNLPPLMPPAEDRPDLWRNDAEPPTFRPRTQGADPNATQGLRVDRGIEVRFVDDLRDRPRPRPRGIRRVFAFLGYGTGDTYRKELVGLVWSLAFGFVQVAIALALIVYASVKRSPKQPSISEWTACDKPLGLWSCFWILKVILDCGSTYWGWRRDWENGQRRRVNIEGDVEEGVDTRSRSDSTPPVHTNLEPPGNGAADGQADGRQQQLDRRSGRYRLYHRLNFLLSLVIISWFLTANILVFTSLHSCRFAAPHLWGLVFGFLCLQYLVILEVFSTALIVFIVGPLILLIWSIVLICLGRHPIQNPHYISPEIGKVSKSVVDQIPLVLYIPTPPGEDEKKDESNQDPAALKPEVSFPSKPKVEHTYPPKQAPPKRRFAFLRSKSSKSTSGLGNGENTGKGELGTEGEKSDPGNIWEDCWESGDFPFVRLDSNRASCAICLLDFEEPKRRVAKEVIKSWALKNRRSSSSFSGAATAAGNGDWEERKSVEKKDKEVQAPSVASNTAIATGASSSSNQAPLPSSPSSLNQQPEPQRHPSSSTDSGDNSGGNSDSSNGEDEDEDSSIRLEDAGEGAQPLRLLPCGHAFHKTCIDPWLTSVSGRCPTCQRPVVPPDPPRRKRNRSEPRHPPPPP